MAKVTITFLECVQDIQEYGSDDEHLVSSVKFTVSVDDQDRGTFSSNIKQVVGSKFEDHPLEIAHPTGYKGPFSYDEFRKAVEDYYRDIIGASGRGIKITPGIHGPRMRNNRISMIKTISFDADSYKDVSW